MKRIEHFCDRCGCKLEEDKIGQFYRWRHNDTTTIEVTVDELTLDYSSVLEKANNTKKALEKEYNYATIRFIRGSRNKSFELCGKCRKDFEEFMKNGH